MENNVKFSEENEKILSGVQSQISSFDSKASILISIVSILLALSLSLIDILPKIVNNKTHYICFSVLYVLYLINAITTIGMSVFVIVPRATPRSVSSSKYYVNYYKNLAKMSYEEYVKNKEHFYEEEKIFFEQIKANSVICESKHKFLRATIYSLIPLAVLLITIVMLAIIFVSKV